MPEISTTNRPALDRRALLHRALAGAAGAAIAVPAAAALAAGVAAADPLPSLIARRMEIVTWINATYAGYDEHRALYDELNALEARIFGATPTTREGVIAQMRFLRAFIEEGFDYDDDCDRLVANMITGAERMGAAA
jgi:hypothetical protein